MKRVLGLCGRGFARSLWSIPFLPGAFGYALRSCFINSGQKRELTASPDKRLRSQFPFLPSGEQCLLLVIRKSRFYAALPFTLVFVVLLPACCKKTFAVLLSACCEINAFD